MRAGEVGHEFLHGVQGCQPIGDANERDARRGAERVEYFVLGGLARELDTPVVRNRLRHLDCHRDHVEVGVDGLRVRPLMAGDLWLGQERVHDAAEVALPRIGGAAQQCTERPFEQASLRERRERAHR